MTFTFFALKRWKRPRSNPLTSSRKEFVEQRIVFRAIFGNLNDLSAITAVKDELRNQTLLKTDFSLFSARLPWRPFLILFTFSILICGCDRLKPKSEEKPVIPTEALKVSVILPQKRQVVDHETFIGRTAAVETVEVRAQVTGYLQKIHFTAGTEVKKGAVLFTLDSREYRAVLDKCTSEAAACQARLKRLEAELVRAQELLPNKVISRAEYDLALADRDECNAQYQSALADQEQAQINLDFTEIKSPINGVVSRELLTIGNLVTARSSLLTTVVSMDPLYVFFDIDERTMLRMTPDHLVRDNDGKTPMLGTISFGTSSENKFPYFAEIDFVEPQVNPKTGTLEMRSIYKNPPLTKGVYNLMPGLPVYVQIPTTAPYESLLIPEEVIQSDQNVKYIFVADAQNKARFRRVSIGALQEDNMRVIRSGLKEKDHVIADNFLRLRPDLSVAPQVKSDSTSTVKVIREDGTVIKDGKVFEKIRIQKETSQKEERRLNQKSGQAEVPVSLNFNGKMTVSERQQAAV